ncbi:MAG: deoxyribose-phosphate aldolase [Marinilabiliales bacterium]|nr:MAG: deoxyribose-phosphate aldolase [Marinilabiliales bacterium]
MKNLEEKFNLEMDSAEINRNVQRIIEKAKGEIKAEKLKKALSFIDLTTLNTQDTNEKVINMCKKVNEFNTHFPDLKNVAAICIYPPFVELLKKNLTTDVNIAVVAAGFPSSQTFISVKLAESKMVVEKGADEVDIVMSVGTFFEKDFDTIFKEIALIKEAIGNAHLKVILETGLLPDYVSIKLASILSMEAGADFIKTSTGKLEPAATPEAVYVMALSIKEFYDKTGKMIGLKPAGGIVTPLDAIIHYTIVEEILGEKWLTPKYFRLGASRLANNMLEEISKISQHKTKKYF